MSTAATSAESPTQRDLHPCVHGTADWIQRMEKEDFTVPCKYRPEQPPWRSSHQYREHAVGRFTDSLGLHSDHCRETSQGQSASREVSNLCSILVLLLYCFIISCACHWTSPAYAQVKEGQYPRSPPLPFGLPKIIACTGPWVWSPCARVKEHQLPPHPPIPRWAKHRRPICDYLVRVWRTLMQPPKSLCAHVIEIWESRNANRCVHMIQTLWARSFVCTCDLDLRSRSGKSGPWCAHVIQIGHLITRNGLRVHVIICDPNLRAQVIPLPCGRSHLQNQLLIATAERVLGTPKPATLPLHRNINAKQRRWSRRTMMNPAVSPTGALTMTIDFSSQNHKSKGLPWDHHSSGTMTHCWTGFLMESGDCPLPCSTTRGYLIQTYPQLLTMISCKLTQMWDDVLFLFLEKQQWLGIFISSLKSDRAHPLDPMPLLAQTRSQSVLSWLPNFHWWSQLCWFWSRRDTPQKSWEPEVQYILSICPKHHPSRVQSVSGPWRSWMDFLIEEDL